MIESKQDFLPKKENSDLRCLAWPFEMNPYSYRRTRRKKKGTCVIYPNSAINDKLLFPFVHYLLLEVKQLSQQVSLAKKKKTLISMKDRSGRMMEAARLLIFCNVSIAKHQGSFHPSLGRGDATATRATLSLCLFRSGVVREPPPLSLSLSFSRLDGRRTRTRLVYIVRSETNEEQHRGGGEEARRKGN